MTPITGTLNPGIARLVHWLRATGFDTIDSGDGRTREHDCDRPYPYVVMRGTEATSKVLAGFVRARHPPPPVDGGVGRLGNPPGRDDPVHLQPGRRPRAR
jgi:hypothetical protein